MTQKLSRYAAKVRQGLVPYRYGGPSTFRPVMRWNPREERYEATEESRRYESEAVLRAVDRNKWRAPLVRIVRHQGIVNGERRLIPLTAEQLRLTRGEHR